jgi:hypothetical protein
MAEAGVSAAGTELSAEQGFSLDGDAAGWIFEVGDPCKVRLEQNSPLDLK